ncbi:hypothetical protein CPB85DRAFT_1302740 [Mucidula mucida]|nr:hypothetical protein CPB85DRAFT_1302740 [Mucidula mucida]
MPVYGGFMISSEEYFRWGKALLEEQGTPLTEERTQELGTFRALSQVYAAVNDAVGQYKTAIIPVRYPTLGKEDEKWIFVTRHGRFTREAFRRLNDDHSKLEQFSWGSKEDFAMQVLNEKGTTVFCLCWK